MAEAAVDVVRVGLIGLGNMGAPMARQLLRPGARPEVRLAVHDVAEEPRRELAAAGAAAPGSAAAVVRDVSVLIVMLPSSDVVEAVLGDPEVRAALRPGTVVVDMSSSEPQRTRTLAADLADAGVSLVDAPVSGGVARARTGQLTIMAGGDPDVVEQVRPVLELMGTVTTTGPVGSGHAAKALNNLLSATHLLVTSEAMLAGQRFGLDPETMLAVFNSSSGRSGSTENKWPNFILTESYDSGFGLRLMLKDMRIAVGLADAVGIASPLGEEAVRVWSRAAEELPPAADHTEIARWLAAHTADADSAAHDAQ
jgi:3-hydroxyisobutyrate dehydrogenase